MSDENNLRIIAQHIKGGTTADLDDPSFIYANRLKFAIVILIDYPHYHAHEYVDMIQEEYLDHDLSTSYCYKLIAEARNIYPSIEKVNKEFERARLSKIAYKLLSIAVEKKNLRDGAQYLKFLGTIHQLEKEGDEAQGMINVINILKSAPETLNVELPKDFDQATFIRTLEKQYAQATEVNAEYSNNRKSNTP